MTSSDAEIKLDSFYVSGTYSGLYACSPEILLEIGTKSRKRIMENPSGPHGLENLWGERQTFHVPPALDSRMKKYGRFPDWMCKAWLHGPPKDGKMTWDPAENLRRLMVGEDTWPDGSELVVVWYQDSVPEDPVRAALAALSSVEKSFKDLAADYWL